MDFILIFREQVAVMHFTQIFGSVTVLTIVCIVSPTSGIRRPHIVFILADDLGWNDVSFHGSSQIPTPNLDALAYDGILLSNYYVQQLCTPTRSALLTGRYPARMGMQHGVLSSAEPYGLPLNETLLPTYLKQLNYSTHIVGKWHLGFYARDYLPTRRGFDSHFGFYQGCGDYFDHTYAPHAPYDLKSWGLDFHRNEEVFRTGFGQYSTDLFTNEAVDIINNHNTTSNQPLFLYLAHQAVHSGTGGTSEPLEAPQRYIDRVAHIKHPMRRMYAAMVTALDESVGHVTRALRDKGLLNDTIIVFSTDNGGPANGYDYNNANNWPLRGMKNTLWEGGVRGAGFIWSPLLEKSGYTSQHLMHVTDWLPTLLHIAGYNMSRLSSLDGFNQWEALSHNKETVRTEILHNFDPRLNASALRVGDFKIVFDAKGHTKKYDDWYKPDDITASLSERKNLSKSEISELESLRQDIHDQLFSWKKATDVSKNFLFQPHSTSTSRGPGVSKVIRWMRPSRGLLMNMTQYTESTNNKIKLDYTNSAINRYGLPKGRVSDEPSHLQINEILSSLGRPRRLMNRSPLVVTCKDDQHYLGSSGYDNDETKRHQDNPPMRMMEVRNTTDLLSEQQQQQHAVMSNQSKNGNSALLWAQNDNIKYRNYDNFHAASGTDKAITGNRKCRPSKRPCLFNIISDPCEKNNLALKYPDVVSSLLHRLEYYKSVSVPPINKPVDEKGLPYHHGRLWIPWVML